MDALATLPLFVKLKGRRAVVAGGSAAAAWKAELLSAAGARVEVYAKAPCDELLEVALSPPAGSVVIARRSWQSRDLAGAAIAIGSVEGEAEASAFVAAARDYGVPVNVIDQPEFCDFQFGAIVNRSPLIVSISTDGGAPVFAQAIRSRLEAMLPQSFKRWAETAKSWRTAGERLGATMAERRRFWELFAARAFTHADRPPGDADFEELLADAATERAENNGTGFVWLAGAGPGDAELLTLKTVRALRTADVVLYDDLVSAACLEFARREATRILVGKTGYGPACKQSEINALMIERARQGKRVVRLKSGDPLIFGRGGEEIAELEAAGIAYEIIPGISAVQAAAAQLKTSLTHRDLARRVQLVTGHSRDGRLPEELDWDSLADARATTAVYMALRKLPELSARLINQGLPGATPAVAIFSATRPGEAVIRDTIAGLPEKLAGGDFDGPCLVLVGEVFGRSLPLPAALQRQEQPMAPPQAERGAD